MKKIYLLFSIMVLQYLFLCSHYFNENNDENFDYIQKVEKKDKNDNNTFFVKLDNQIFEVDCIKF